MQYIEKIFPELANQPVAVICIYFAILFVIYFITIVASWKMFVKMGEKGWKCLIPIYSSYILVKRCSKTKFFWLTFLFAIVVGVLNATATALGSENAASVVLNVFIIILGIIMLVWQIIIYYHISKSFGHGVGYTIGLIFLPFIFHLILSFGSSEYIGNATEKK